MRPAAVLDAYIAVTLLERLLILPPVFEVAEIDIKQPCRDAGVRNR